MTYRDRTTGEYPITLAAIRRRVNIAFGAEPTPTVLDAAGVDAVEATAPPTPGAGKIVREGEPAKVSGKWRQTWLVEDAPPEPERTYNFLQFVELFTPTEQAQLTAAAIADPVNVGLWYFKAVGTGELLMSDPRTYAGIQALVDNGLINEARRDQVLAGEIPGNV